MWFRRITLAKHVKRAQAELQGQRIKTREADVHREEESEDEDEIQDFRRVQIVKKGVSVGHFPPKSRSPSTYQHPRTPIDSCGIFFPLAAICRPRQYSARRKLA